MTELERIWGAKSDEALLEAAASLGDFTDEGRAVVLGELERRGLEAPAGAKAEADPDDDESEGAALPDDPLTCLRCGVKLQHLGTRDISALGGPLGEFGRMFEGRELLEVYACPRCGHVDMFTDVQGEAGVGGEDGDEEDGNR